MKEHDGAIQDEIDDLRAERDLCKEAVDEASSRMMHAADKLDALKGDSRELHGLALWLRGSAQFVLQEAKAECPGCHVRAAIGKDGCCVDCGRGRVEPKDKPVPKQSVCGMPYAQRSGNAATCCLERGHSGPCG